MDSLISLFGKVLTPTIVVSVISTIVGAFIAYTAYKLNRQRKEFDTSNYIRNVLTSLFEFDRKIGDELALIKGYRKAKDFYNSMKSSKDYSNMIRIGITLVGFEIDNGLVDAASGRLEEISDKDLRKGANLDTEFIHRKIELQKKRLNYYTLFGENDEPW